jgi:hypothetical protein
MPIWHPRLATHVRKSPSVRSSDPRIAICSSNPAAEIAKVFAQKNHNCFSEERGLPCDERQSWTKPRVRFRVPAPKETSDHKAGRFEQ